MSALVTYTVLQIPIDRIRAFAFQPRKWFDPEELTARAESMKALGQQDPVTVEPVVGDPDHDYELINGESRLRSAQQAGLTTLWAAVRSEPFGSKVEKHLASLVANFNRSDHTPMEISDALRVQCEEGGMSQADVARAIGKPCAWVSKYLSLQRLLPEIQALLHPSAPKRQRVAPATAFELARLPHDKQLDILQKVRFFDGKATMQRVKFRTALHDGLPTCEPSENTWTLEREMTRRAHYKRDQKQVEHLRAGIDEFRTMLQRRWG